MWTEYRNGQESSRGESQFPPPHQRRSSSTPTATGVVVTVGEKLHVYETRFLGVFVKSL